MRLPDFARLPGSDFRPTLSRPFAVRTPERVFRLMPYAFAAKWNSDRHCWEPEPSETIRAWASASRELPNGFSFFEIPVYVEQR